MSFEAGSIFGTLGLDISPFTKGMFGAIEAAKIFPTIVGSFLADPLLGFADLVKDAFEEVDKAFFTGIDYAKEYASAIKEVGFADAEAAETAQTLGLSVEAYTALAGAAKLAGSNEMDFSESLRFLNRNVADAAQGNQELRKEFWELGVQIFDASGHLRDSQAIFYNLADSIRSIPDAAQRTRFTMDLMGRGVGSMVPFLARGSAGIKELMKDMVRLGATTSKTAAESGDKFRHLSYDWDFMWEGIKSKATEPVIDMIANHFGSIQKAIFGISDIAGSAINDAFTWISAHSKQIKDDVIGVELAAEHGFNWLAAHGPAILNTVGDAIASIKEEGEEAFGWWSSNKEELFKSIEKFAHEIGPALVGLAVLETTAHIAGLISKLTSLTDAFGLAGVAGKGFSAIALAAATAGAASYINASAHGAGEHEKTDRAWGAGAGAAMGFAAAGPAGAAFGGYVGDLFSIQLGRYYDAQAAARRNYSPNITAADLTPPPGGLGPIDNRIPTKIDISMSVDPSKVAAEVHKQMFPSLKKAIESLHQKIALTGQKAAQMKGLGS